MLLIPEPAVPKTVTGLNSPSPFFISGEELEMN